MNSPKSIFQHIIDLIYPLVVPNFEDSKGFSFTKNLTGLAVDNIWIANSLDNKTIGKTIVRIKDGGEFALVRFLAEDFVKQIIDFGMITASRKDFEDQESQAIFEMFANLFDPNTKTLLTFVPPDPARLTKRGFHLPELLAKELQKQLDLKANAKKVYDLQYLFVKAKKTKRQTGLDRQQRLVNLTGKIELGKNVTMNINPQDNLSVFIIDDVCTTGATINECAMQIKVKFPKIKVYGLAVASNL
jgi:predicted amidophosphoribosyltransferase